MSIVESSKHWLENHESTDSAGRSLAASLYDLPVTILLRGELGAGKTTFLKGFAKGLGVQEDVTSPSYALEQRYSTTNHGQLLHIDLYRLTPTHARDLLASSDEFEGIRCIEWPERLETDLEKAFPEAIDIALSEERNGRALEATFRDIPLPSPAMIAQWRTDVRLPENVIAHCETVAIFAAHLADILLQRNEIVRKEALRTAGSLHDLLRFVDFRRDRPGKAGNTGEEESLWEEWIRRYPDQRHEDAVASFLGEQGFTALARIVHTHGLRLPPRHQATIEQRVLFYADKRVKLDEVVSLEERFRDFNERYAGSHITEGSQKWLATAKELEKELFPEGAPSR
ncbi:MAG: tRNA (adenosine(37)-N6)-threonylcarbamoyltransferase complex ATPase subunit type 1 TsaE [Candidatus Peribacteraceae bacterium]